MAYQKFIVLGNLGRDPELNYTPSGSAVCNFSVAVSEKWKDNETTVWFKCAAWGKLGETIATYFKGGDEIMFEGKVNAPDSWVSGTEAKAANNVTVLGFTFTKGKKNHGSNNSSVVDSIDIGEEVGNSELPF